MELVTLKEILSDAKKGKYAVGGFNFNGHDDTQGIVNAAIEKKSPLILMSTVTVVEYIGIHQIVGMVSGMAKSSDIPICLHFDHATDVDMIKEAIKAGFSSVMIDASSRTYEENIEISKSVSIFAKDYNCSVEAELGKVVGKEGDVVVTDDDVLFTDPNDVPRFVEETKIDALAVAIGTVHGFYKKEPKIDFERLEKILKITNCPLVLHGGSGISVEDFKKCVEIGISKINIGTELKVGFTNGMRKAVLELPEKEIDPKKYLEYAKKLCCEIAKEKMDIFGCSNKA